ncbi:MAG TPA: YcaO-like family protein [Candidatus Baltobacteraceae bacterium]
MRKFWNSFDRSVPLEQTLATAKALRGSYGITRIGETTYLDRIGIPTISAVVPNSPDILGVYNGKGLSRDHAVASALMEALERQICARHTLPVFQTSVAGCDSLLDLKELGWLGEIRGTTDAIRGTNLLTGDPVEVPRGLVDCPRRGPQLFRYTSTNGLASGNNATEAIYHALFELIERHMWSSVHVRAHIWPRALHLRSGLPLEAPDDAICDDVVDADRHPIVGDLLQRVTAAGLDIRLLTFRQRGWPSAMLACIKEPEQRRLFYHLGMGCSWSPAHAAIRAITEAAQARVTDIQGAREDIRQADDGPKAERFEHGRRPSGYPMSGRWYFDGPAGAVKLADLEDRSATDLARELDAVLDTLRSFGETCVAYVDLTPPGCPVSVARVIVPHLERTLVDGSISSRFRRLFDNPLGSFT